MQRTSQARKSHSPKRERDPYVRVAVVASCLWGLLVLGQHDGDAYRSQITWNFMSVLGDVRRFQEREGRLPESSAELPVMNDPWGRPYRYERAPGCIDPELVRCRVFTLGSDDAEGGRGRATDRSSRWFW